MKSQTRIRLHPFALAGAIVALALVLAGCAPAHEWHGTRYQDTPTAPALNLSLVDGGEFSLQDHSGQVVLLYFGYTHCPDMCPATLADLSWIQRQLTDRSEQVTVAFVSVDPQRDHPQVIEQYLTNFDGDFLGLHGSEQQLEEVMKGYGVFAQVDEGGEGERYTVSHTSRVFLIDTQGRLQAHYSFGTPREDLLADVVHLLENN